MAAIDTSLPGSATGAAATFAAAHAAPHELKLYGGWFCPFVQRAWIVLHEKRIAHQYVEINPYQKAPEFLALNPRGLVPTLAVPAAAAATQGTNGQGGEGGGEKPLYESTIVCEYLDEAYSDETQHGQALLPRGSAPADAYARARCRLWIDHVGSKILPAFYRVLQHTSTATSPYTLSSAREALHAALRALVAEMDGSGAGPWFLGARFSLVDVALAPWAKRLFLLDHYKDGGSGIPEVGGEGDDEVWGRWRVWVGAVGGRESVKATWSEEGMYVRAYQRYAEDTTQSEVAKATRKGERLP
ncbi:glutathione S-transferase [Nemania diffusa]|nr:glutathione S-transferase [Nemania diffusa]